MTLLPVIPLLAQLSGFDASSPGYFELLERYSHIIYPALAVLVLVLLVAGIFSAWKDQDLAGLAKVEIKREIILELRRQRGGASAEELARAVGLPSLKTVKLLEEMQKEGLLMSHTNTQRLTVWRLKSLGGSSRFE